MTTIYTFNNKVLKNSANDKWLIKKEGPAPIVLPEYTVRFELPDGAYFKPKTNFTITQVSQSPNLWDFTYINSDWSAMLGSGWNKYGLPNMMQGSGEVGVYPIGIVAANLNGVTTIERAFRYANGYGSNLTYIGQISGNTLTNVDSAFNGQINLESGILSTYNYLTSLGAQIASYSNCFTNCGSNTTTGSAELAQIPSSWGGTGA